jgi:hypothetical protein
MDSSAPNPPRIWQRRSLWLLLLVLCAVVYYGSYYRYGINFRDEGGTTVLNGQRLLEGEVPFVNLTLGYNVGWFAPIVALFKITGVNFVAARVFFMVLAALTAAMAFLTIDRVARYTGRDRLAAPLAFAVGIFIMLTPGMLFKNYNPLSVVANAWCLISFILADDFRKANWRALVGGLVLGTTWLLRIEIGTLWTILWLGVLLCRLPGPRAHLNARLASSGVALLLVMGSVAILHAPFFVDAYRRDYLPNLAASYPSQWRDMLRRVPGFGPKATPRAESVPSAVPAPVAGNAAGVPAPAAAAAEKAAATPAAPPASKPASSWKAGTQSRTTWASVSQASEKDYWNVLGLFILTYFPLLILLPLAAWAGVAWLRTAFSGGDSRLPLAALIAVGGSLTLFAQFFIWRPDSPHLSEFGPGYWVGTVGALLLLRAHRPQRRWILLFSVLLAAHATIWMVRMFPDRWCGSIAARWSRKVLLEVENGVSVYEQKGDVQWMNDMVKAIQEHSKPGEYLVAYPYHPAFNVMANRPTYESNVYIDNAEASAKWSHDANMRIYTHKPAVIIIGDWAINGTEESRFKNWAAPVLDYVRRTHDLVGTFDPNKENFRLYVRRAIPPSPAAIPAARVEKAAEKPVETPPAKAP